MSPKIDVSVMKTLFRELWLQSDICTESFGNIWFSISEVAKSTSNSTKEIKRYLDFLVENRIIELISEEPLLYQFTENGKQITTEFDIQEILKSYKTN